MIALKKMAGIIFCCTGIYSASMAASYTNVKNKLEIEIDSNHVASLSEERRDIVLQIKEALENELYYYSKYEVKLPTSSLSERAERIITLDSLFRKPNAKEVMSLAFDENGEHKKLSQAQLDQLRKEGIFIIPSKEYPGQNHIWRVSLILQKGSNNIQISYKENLGKAVDQIIVQIPERLAADGMLSVGRGINNIYHGLRGILSNLVGLKEQERKYSEYEVNDIIAKEKQKFILENFAEYDSPLLETVIPRDLRLYDEELTKELAPILSRMETRFQIEWNNKLHNIKINLKKELSKTITDEDQLKVELSKQIDELHASEYDQFIINYAELEQAQVGYGQLLVNHNIALRVSQEIELNLQKLVEAQEELITFQTKLTHPTKSLAKEWLSEQVENQSRDFYKEIKWPYLSSIPITLEKMGLNQEAFIFSKILNFQKESEEKLRQELESELVAADKHSYYHRIWNSNNWIPEPSYDYDGNIEAYYPQKYMKTDIETDQNLWRLRAVGAETQADFSNGLYRVLVSNLLNGPVGLKSMFYSKPYYASDEMNPKNAEITPDSDSISHTYTSRLKGIWEQVSLDRQNFESTPDVGFLGKKYSRWLNQFWTYVVKGAGGTVAVGLGQPIATTCNVAACAAATVTAPVWAPLSAMFKLGFNSLIYDFKAPSSQHLSGRTVHKWFPVVNYALSDVAVLGAGQTLVAGTAATLAHPGYALSLGLYGELTRVMRTAYDAGTATIFFKYGRWPGNDSWLAWRVGGPGISSNYYYQVRPEIALMALQAKLESIELDLVQKKAKSMIAEPMNNYFSFFRDILNSYSTANPTGIQSYKLLKDLKEDQEKLLDKTISSRRKMLNRLLNTSIDKNLIRQSEEDMEETLMFSNLLVSRFFEENIDEKIEAKELKAFWEKVELEEGDFEGLTKHLYKSIFSSNFLETLEKSDKDFIIEVADKNLMENIRDLSVEPSA